MRAALAETLTTDLPFPLRERVIVLEHHAWEWPRIEVTCRTMGEARAIGRRFEPSSEPRIIRLRWCMEDPSGLSIFTVRLDGARS